jgi:Xaa-Pro aminopeptidase
VCPAVDVAAADEICVYQAKRHSTLRNDQPAAAAQVLRAAIAPPKGRLGVEFSSCGPGLTESLSVQLVDIEPDLYRLRRRKDADELARLRKAIDGTARMYEKAREIIAPGMNELDLFNELQAVAVREFDEMLTGTGNDYRCNARGGPPRNRQAQAGELYILDLGPAFRGYFADNARTVAVTQPDARQMEAWHAIQDVFHLVQGTIKPGVSCRKLFADVQALLDKCPLGVFDHHLGHGIGLFPHEAPHLNPHWDDVFEVGDVFTAEPGLYDADLLRAGIRIENDYVVTEDGVELLSDFPLQL